MAEKGLILSKEGFFAGFAMFQKQPPQRIRYRLEASQKSSILSDDNPEQEELDLSEAYGWKYIAKRGDFYVFATRDPYTCELHTDPKVQALALNKIRRRMWSDCFVLLFWAIVYPFLIGKGVFLLTAIKLGSPLYFLTQILFIWSIGSSVRSFLYLYRLQKRLKRGTPPDHQKNWRRHAGLHHVSVITYFVLVICWCIMLLYIWNADTTGKYERSLKSYNGKIPFATLESFAPGGTFIWDENDFSNKIKVQSDLLAPQVISLSQSGTIYKKNGTALSGGVNVEYVETRSPWMARQLAVEYERFDRRTNKKYYQPLFLPDNLNADYAVAYDAIFPTAVLVKDNKVVRFCFYQTSENNTIPLEEWVSVVADSLANEP